MIAVDTDILIYAHRAETEQHKQAARELVALAATAERADARGNLMFNAQIAALCREHGISAILTNDRDFERFSSLDVRYLEKTTT